MILALPSRPNTYTTAEVQDLPSTPVIPQVIAATSDRYHRMRTAEARSVSGLVPASWSIVATLAARRPATVDTLSRCVTSCACVARNLGMSGPYISHDRVILHDGVRPTVKCDLGHDLLRKKLDFAVYAWQHGVEE